MPMIKFPALKPPGSTPDSVYVHPEAVLGLSVASLRATTRSPLNPQHVHESVLATGTTLYLSGAQLHVEGTPEEVLVCLEG